MPSAFFIKWLLRLAATGTVQDSEFFFLDSSDPMSIGVAVPFQSPRSC